MKAFQAFKTAAATGMVVLASSAALAGPEIKVQMLLFGQGAFDVDEAGSVTFPEIELGDDQAIFFSIENTGDEDLVLDNPAVSIVDQGGGFSVLAQPSPFPIPAGFSKTFRIKHVPGSDALRQARMFIFSNATNTAGPFDATLLGKALPVEADPIDEDEPNEPVDDDGDEDPNDNEYVDDPNDLEDPNDLVQDPNEYAGDPNEYDGDPNEYEQDPNDEYIPIDDFMPVVPGCGFGIGFASMMCMVSLCGVRRHGR